MSEFRWRVGWSVRRGMSLCGAVVLASVSLFILLPPTMIGVIVLFLVVSLLLVLFIHRFRHAALAFCLAVAVLSILRCVVYNTTQVPPVSDLIGETDTIAGTVVECPSNGRMYTVRITQAQRLRVGTRLLLYCSDRVAPRLNETVATTVEYRALYDSQKHQRANNVYIQAFPTSYDDAAITVLPADPLASWTTWLEPVRDCFKTVTKETLSNDEGALLVAMCLGDKSQLPPSVYNAFRACGLPHLIAVSGLHLTVIAGSLQSGLRHLRFRKKIIGGVTLIAMFLYMWMVGFTPSVIRSGLMYGIVLVGMLFRRQSDALNSLGLALTVILLLSPNAFYDLGFWLSFSSTAGIICLYPRLRLWRRCLFAFVPSIMQRPVGWISDSFSITVAATIPLLPMLALTFRELPLVSPLANLLTVVPSGWMLVLGFLGILIRVTFIFSWVGDLLLLVAGLIAKYMIAVVDWLGAFSGATMLLQHMWQILWLVGASIALFVAMRYFRAHTLRRLWCGLLVLFIIAHTSSALLNKGATTVHILSENNSAAIVLAHEGKTAVLVQDLKGLYTARRQMENDGYRYPTLLLLGDGEQTYASALAEFLDTYPDVQTITTGSAKVLIPQSAALTTGDIVQFWGNYSIRVLDEGWWLLTMGETTLLIAPPGGRELPQKAVADGYVLFADVLPDTLSINTSQVFCICSEGTTVTADGPLEIITDEAGSHVVTGGFGDWHPLWFA